MGLTRVLGISIPSFGCPKELVAVLKWDRLESVTCVSPVACAGLGLTGGMSGMWQAPESLDGRFGEPKLKQYEVTARGPSTQQGPAVAETSDAFHEAA